MTCRQRLVLLFLSVPVLAGACEREAGPPRLELFPTVYDRGHLTSVGGTGRAVGARFRIRNGGQGPLHLRAVVSDCACHAAIVGADVISSNEQAMVVARCRAVAGAGDVRQLRLHSNDPEYPTRVLAVRVPEDDRVARPAAIAFGYVEVGRAVTREIVVPDASPQLRLEPGTAAFSLALDADERDGARTYRVRFVPQQPGVARAILERGAGAVPIAVSGVGVGDLAAFPAEVRTPSAVAEDLPRIFLKNLTEAPVEITRVDYPSGIAGELHTLVAGEEFLLRLRSVGSEGDTRPPGAIRVHTTASDASSVVVPVVRTASRD